MSTIIFNVAAVWLQVDSAPSGDSSADNTSDACSLPSSSSRFRRDQGEPTSQFSVLAVSKSYLFVLVHGTLSSESGHDCHCDGDKHTVRRTNLVYDPAALPT